MVYRRAYMLSPMNLNLVDFSLTYYLAGFVKSAVF